ncbi:hypothetical protein FUAX_24310 [Fulvitalea axinellae]|uniref:Uncharacterized protein n=2 Tax=Fulvitalea axinellae TaxID=1182444 RepID=A0AAU9CU63_9BACT|nr:hypothetical protein FUAX_24310 [Fulvitalea axinellae]
MTLPAFLEMTHTEDGKRYEEAPEFITIEKMLRRYHQGLRGFSGEEYAHAKMRALHNIEQAIFSWQARNPFPEEGRGPIPRFTIAMMRLWDEVEDERYELVKEIIDNHYAFWVPDDQMELEEEGMVVTEEDRDLEDYTWVNLGQNERQRLWDDLLSAKYEEKGTYGLRVITYERQTVLSLIHDDEEQATESASEIKPIVPRAGGAFSGHRTDYDKKLRTRAQTVMAESRSARYSASSRMRPSRRRQGLEASMMHSIQPVREEGDDEQPRSKLPDEETLIVPDSRRFQTEGWSELFQSRDRAGATSGARLQSMIDRYVDEFPEFDHPDFYYRIQTLNAQLLNLPTGKKILELLTKPLGEEDLGIRIFPDYIYTASNQGRAAEPEEYPVAHFRGNDRVQITRPDEGSGEGTTDPVPVPEEAPRRRRCCNWIRVAINAYRERRARQTQTQPMDYGNVAGFAALFPEEPRGTIMPQVFMRAKRRRPSSMYVNLPDRPDRNRMYTLFPEVLEYAGTLLDVIEARYYHSRNHEVALNLDEFVPKAINSLRKEMGLPYQDLDSRVIREVALMPDEAVLGRGYINALDHLAYEDEVTKAERREQAMATERENRERRAREDEFVVVRTGSRQESFAASVDSRDMTDFQDEDFQQSMTHDGARVTKASFTTYNPEAPEWADGSFEVLHVKKERAGTTVRTQVVTSRELSAKGITETDGSDSSRPRSRSLGKPERTRVKWYDDSAATGPQKRRAATTKSLDVWKTRMGVDTPTIPDKDGLEDLRKQFRKSEDEDEGDGTTENFWPTAST